MINNNSENHPPEIEIIGGVIEVTGSPDGRGLIGGLWKIFTTSYQVQKGDFLMDRSRGLLQRHLRRIELLDQDIIRQTYEAVNGTRKGIEEKSGPSSLFLRNLEARKYRRGAKMMYQIVQRASARALDKHFLNQIDEAMRPPAPEDGLGKGGPGTGPLTDAVSPDPTSDSHAAMSMITDINVDNIEHVEMSSIYDESTDEEAAMFDLVNRDQSVKRIIAFSDGRTDNASLLIASVPVSHQQDGSASRFIAACVPDDSDERADEQAEERTLDSFALNELDTSEGERPRLVTGASVHPVDGDLYSRSFAPSRW